MDESVEDITAADTAPRPKKATALGVRTWRTSGRTTLEQSPDGGTMFILSQSVALAIAPKSTDGPVITRAIIPPPYDRNCALKAVLLDSTRCNQIYSFTYLRTFGSGAYLIVALPWNTSQKQEEGVVHPEAPVLGGDLAVPGGGHSIRQLGLVDVGHGLVGDGEGKGQELK